ncbi:MAG: hypothetical protein FWC46_05800 [Actinomycetia bacterium]|nr:hypothetical protein [Actinomycetes bacterium]
MPAGAPYPPGPAGYSATGAPVTAPGRPTSGSLNLLDVAVAGVTLLVLIFSFLPYYTASVSWFGIGSSQSFNAWHGWLSPLGICLVLLGGAIMALAEFGVVAEAQRVTARLAALVGAGVGWVLLLISMFVTPRFQDVTPGMLASLGITVGRGAGFWLELAAATGLLLLTGWIYLKARDAGVVPAGAALGRPGRAPVPGFARAPSTPTAPDWPQPAPPLPPFGPSYPPVPSPSAPPEDRVYPPAQFPMPPAPPGAGRGAA